MSIIDIRKPYVEIETIVFAEHKITFVARDSADEVGIGYILEKNNGNYPFPCIRDLHEYVLIPTKQDAENLIKALNKALVLGWWDNVTPSKPLN